MGPVDPMTGPRGRLRRLGLNQGHPRSYYGAFSFFFRSRLYVLFLTYVAGVIISSGILSAIIEVEYAGPEGSRPRAISWEHHFYFATTTLISPGFTEFVPRDDASRRFALAGGVFGIAYNALFLSILVARILQAREPFVVVPFLLYHPRNKTLTARFYSTLPTPAFNLRVRFFRFVIHTDESIAAQVGRTIEIATEPKERSTILPHYGLLVRVKVAQGGGADRPDPSDTELRAECPRDWVLPDLHHGHFDLVLEAETTYGKMFQSVRFFPGRRQIRCGTHSLLNEGRAFSLDDWYHWWDYRWDLWSRRNPIPADQVPEEGVDPVWEHYWDERGAVAPVPPDASASD